MNEKSRMERRDTRRVYLLDVLYVLLAQAVAGKGKERTCLRGSRIKSKDVVGEEDATRENAIGGAGFRGNARRSAQEFGGTPEDGRRKRATDKLGRGSEVPSSVLRHRRRGNSKDRTTKEVKPRAR